MSRGLEDQEIRSVSTYPILLSQVFARPTSTQIRRLMETGVLIAWLEPYHGCSLPLNRANLLLVIICRCQSLCTT